MLLARSLKRIKCLSLSDIIEQMERWKKSDPVNMDDTITDALACIRRKHYTRFRPNNEMKYHQKHYQDFIKGQRYTTESCRASNHLDTIDGFCTERILTPLNLSNEQVRAPLTPHNLTTFGSALEYFMVLDFDS